MHDLSTLWYNLNLSVLTLHLEVCMFHILWGKKYTRCAKNYTAVNFRKIPISAWNILMVHHCYFHQIYRIVKILFIYIFPQAQRCTPKVDSHTIR